MSVSVRQCTVDEVFTAPNIDALLAEYASESSIAGLPAPAPHRELYDMLETSGHMSLFGAFRGELLVGFIVIITMMSPHYSVQHAVVDSYFVAAEQRCTGAGLQLLRVAERDAASRGAVGFLVSAPANGRLAAVMAEMTSYKQTHLVFCRSFA